MEGWFNVTVNEHSAKGKNININSPTLLKYLTLFYDYFVAAFVASLFYVPLHPKLGRAVA